MPEWMELQRNWPKRPSDHQLQEAQKKRLRQGHNSWGRDSPVTLHTLCCQGPCKPSSCTTFRLHSHWGRAATSKKKNLAFIHAGSHWSCPTLDEPVDYGLPAFSVREKGFSRQEYWSVSANTGCHTLLVVV